VHAAALSRKKTPFLSYDVPRVRKWYWHQVWLHVMKCRITVSPTLASFLLNAF
jgi:hypothetical protein